MSFSKVSAPLKSSGFNKSLVSDELLTLGISDPADYFSKNVRLVVRIQSAWRKHKAREAVFVRQIEKRDTTQKIGQLLIKVFDEDLGLMEPYKVMVFENRKSINPDINIVARCLSNQTKKFGLTLDSSAMLELSSLPGAVSQGPGGASLGLGLPEDN